MSSWNGSRLLPNCLVPMFLEERRWVRPFFEEAVEFTVRRRRSRSALNWNSAKQKNLCGMSFRCFPMLQPFESGLKSRLPDIFPRRPIPLLRLRSMPIRSSNCTFNTHLRLTQVTLRDRTDDRDELVFENEWLLHPNESLLQLKGNVFIVEDTPSGNGFVFLKEAPEPDMRPLPIPFDCRFSGSGMSARKKGDSDSFPYFDLSFYGNDLATAGRGYPFALIAYHGGRTGRIAAMQRYQRQIRQYVAGRDGLLLSNTWGDRSGDSKLNENFIDREIDAGWQTGKATGMTGDGGVWDRYWETDPRFWEPDGQRFPRGISSVSEYAHARGIRLGLWFAPDSYEDFANWHKDADQLTWYRDEHVDAFVGFSQDPIEGGGDELSRTGRHGDEGVLG
jgi:hypothetical protein